MNELREMILQERDERKDEAKSMDDFFRTENPEDIEGYEITRTNEVHYVGEHI